MKKIVGFALLVFLCSLCCLGLDEWLRREGAELAALEEQIAVLERECDGLALEIAEATSPEALAHRAEELGMVLAQENDRAWLLKKEPQEVPTEKEPRESDVFDVFGALLRREI